MTITVECGKCGKQFEVDSFDDVTECKFCRSKDLEAVWFG